MTDTVTTGHFTLTSEQRQFKKMINEYPLLASYWHFETRDCDLQAINADIGVLSSGEQHMLRFFVAIWLGENKLKFDLIGATKALDDGCLDDIRQWLQTPVFP